MLDTFDDLLNLFLVKVMSMLLKLKMLVQILKNLFKFKDTYAGHKKIISISLRIKFYLHISFPYVLWFYSVLLPAALFIHLSRNIPVQESTLADKFAILTLPNGRVIPIDVAPNIDVNIDSIFQEHPIQASSSREEWCTLKVPSGHPTVQMRLPDGSFVDVNTGSTLRFPARFGDNKREVYLVGEAYFEVMSDFQRLFTVHTAALDVKVTGTSFNVNSYPDADTIQVSLLSGSVLVCNKKIERRLQPGETAILHLDSSKLVVAPFDKNFLLAWRQGKYFCNARPLKELCQIASRLYGVQIFIEREWLADKHFTGIINREGGLQGFLSDIKTSNNIDHFFDTEGAVHLR